MSQFQYQYINYVFHLGALNWNSVFGRDRMKVQVYHVTMCDIRIALLYHCMNCLKIDPLASKYFILFFCNSIENH